MPLASFFGSWENWLSLIVFVSFFPPKRTYVQRKKERKKALLPTNTCSLTHLLTHSCTKLTCTFFFLANSLLFFPRYYVYTYTYVYVPPLLSIVWDGEISFFSLARPFSLSNLGMYECTISFFPSRHTFATCETQILTFFPRRQRRPRGIQSYRSRKWHLLYGRTTTTHGEKETVFIFLIFFPLPSSFNFPRNCFSGFLGNFLFKSGISLSFWWIFEQTNEKSETFSVSFSCISFAVSLKKKRATEEERLRDPVS